MKRATNIALKGLLVAGLMVPTALAQSQNHDLGEYAREHKKEKEAEAPTKRVYDNDNLPHEEHISIVGPSEQSANDQKAQKANPHDSTSPPSDTNPKNGSEPGQAADAASAAKTSTTPGDSPDQRQQAYGDWQKKISDQKQALDLVSRELNVLQGEYRMRAAAVYADVGYRLRNAAQWDKEDAQYKEKIAAKQKAVDAAKQQLADLQEQARKSGVPSKLRE